MPTSQIAKGVTKIEQLNIEGKRSGKGFVVHKSMLASALSRVLAERLNIGGVEVGTKGLRKYFSTLSGSNIIKVLPDGESLKVLCGTHTGQVNAFDWTDDRTPLNSCEVRVSPHHSIQPNIGSTELAHAIIQVLPFTAPKPKKNEPSRPVLECVNIIAADGKLTLVSGDGFILSEVKLDCEVEGQVLINRDELKGVASALRKAKRARVSFEKSEGELDGTALVIETELIRYTLTGYVGEYPAYQKLIPSEFNTFASLDTIETLQAIASLVALSSVKDSAIDLKVGDGVLTLSNPDDRGQVQLTADTSGEGQVRVNATFLTKVLKACQGMLDFSLTNGYSPMLFSQNGNKVVVMPMMSNKANSEKHADAEAATFDTEATETEAEATETETEGQTEAEGQTETEATETETEATEETTKPVKASRKRKQSVTA